MTVTKNLIPNGEQVFLDNNGSPLALGTVEMYVPLTSTPKATWSDPAGTVLNTFPILLDAFGRTVIYGLGDYRQVVKDSLGNVIWDRDTAVPTAKLTPGTTFLRADIPTSTITVDTFIASGYYVGGDLGAGAIYTSVGATAGGAAAIQDAAGTWFNLADSDFDVGWFGAKGDGVTDDSAAITAAMTAATTLGATSRHDGIGWSIPVIFPSKVFVCGDLVVPDYVVLTGKQTVDDNPAATLQQKAGTVWIAGNAATVTGAGVVGLFLIGLGATTNSVAIDFADVQRGIFAGNHIDNFGMQGIKLTAIASLVHDNFMFNCLMNRTAVVSKSGVLEIDGTDCFIYNNEATASVPTDYTSINLYCCGILIKGASHFVRDNVGEISDTGMRIEANLCRVSSNRCDSNWAHGYEIAGSGNMIFNCLGFNNSLHGDNIYTDFLITGGSNQITSCVSNGSTKIHKFGFEDTKVGDVGKNSYIGCRAIGAVAQTFGMAGFAGSAVTVVSGQDRALTADSATPSVDGYENWSTANTVPITITDFTLGCAGQKILIRFGDANTSIARSATIVTPTGATVGPYTAGQFQGLINSDGAWYFTTNNP